jgi:CRP-like cAMP-binding protein
MDYPTTADHLGNTRLEALPAAARHRFLAQLTPVTLSVKDVLFEPGQVITDVYFPISGVISLVTPLEDGNIVEVATIGNEGIVGVPLRNGGSLAMRAISQVAGSALRMSADVFLAELATEKALRDIVQVYTQALFGQIAQAAACNRMHSNEERLSRWLLMSHDRVGQDAFDITHEFLGQMLGSRRATVTLSMGVLQAAGLIRYHRGRVTIIDRQGLEEVSCECYGVIQAAFDKDIVAGSNGDTAGLNGGTAGSNGGTPA